MNINDLIARLELIRNRYPGIDHVMIPMTINSFEPLDRIAIDWDNNTIWFINTGATPETWHTRGRVIEFVDHIKIKE